MKSKRPIVMLIFGAFILLCVWCLTAPAPPASIPYSIASQKRSIANIKAQNESFRSNALAAAASRKPVLVSGFVPIAGGAYVETPGTNGLVEPKFTSPTDWPDDARPEVKSFYQFAKIARLYKFDPAVVVSKDSLRYQKSVATTTHEADIDTRSQRVEKLASYRDRSASLIEYPDVADDWSNATGQWHERQMVEETFRILRELGYMKTLADVSQGRHEFKPEPWRVKLPEGGFKIVYPFATVKLYGAKIQGGYESPRVTAQYRMGPDGPVGLVDWFSLY